MDLLRNAYTSDEDDDRDENRFPTQPPVKGHKPEILPHVRRQSPQANYHRSNPRKESFIPGRYVSKRERMASGESSSSSSSVTDSTKSSTIVVSPVIASVSTSNIRPDIASSLRSHGKGSLACNAKIPERVTTVLNSHTSAVSSMEWSPTHHHLLASAGMDGFVYVWNVWSKESQKKARVFNNHNGAVKCLRWRTDGPSLLSCGYDCASRLIDVEKGIEMQTFKEEQIVGVVKFHPSNSNLFISGGSKGLLSLWDIRVGKVVKDFVRNLGPILDVDFSGDGKEFISSTDISMSNASENSIIVWDTWRQVPLSNQVYTEAYTCPCVKYHPFDPFFVAQSNGNYIAKFSSYPPYRLDKFKRYESHGVSGFPIKCDFSLDGEKLASGSSDGCIYLYNYKSGNLLRKIKAYEQPCVDVAFHPILSNVIASCCWGGNISVFE